MSMAFPVTCGTLTVGQLATLLRQFDDSAEVYFSADRLPVGVGRLCVQTVALAAESLRIAPAEILGYCRQADSHARRDAAWAGRVPEPAPRPAEPSRQHRSLGTSATRVA